jgi:CHASE domain
VIREQLNLLSPLGGIHLTILGHPMIENDTENTVKVAPINESFQVRERWNETESSRMRKIGVLLKRHQALAAQHPQLILLAITFFVVTLGSGIAIATVYANVEQDEKEANALTIAVETGRFFSHNLDRAILPLFSLAQFVREIQEFRELPDLIGLSNAEGSLPFLPPSDGLDRPTHRNVSGVCDDPPLLERYIRIAGAIKEDADMDGVLVNLQLVPDGVVCLVHPVNNTEDFPRGVHLDSTVTIGHDLLYDPERKFMAEATVASEKVVIVGPIQLLQCPRHDCDPLVEKAFIARLPILSKTNEIFVNGESHMRWGFAVALINWNVLVENSGIYDEFEKSNLEFQLTRTDYIPNPDVGTTQNVSSQTVRFSF